MLREREVIEALKVVSDYYDTCKTRTTGTCEGCPFSVRYWCALEQYDEIPGAEKNVEKLEQEVVGDAGS